MHRAIQIFGYNIFGQPNSSPQLNALVLAFIEFHLFPNFIKDEVNFDNISNSFFFRSQLGTKLQTTEIQTFDDLDKIIPNGKAIVLHTLDDLFKNKVGLFDLNISCQSKILFIICYSFCITFRFLLRHRTVLL
jgi:hypothetical protein